MKLGRVVYFHEISDEFESGSCHKVTDSSNRKTGFSL